MKMINLFNHENPARGKYRHELKYICTEGELRIIENRIKSICRPDIHAKDDGIYRIRSIYFDDSEDRCYYENENGTDPREKFRIRSYDADDSVIVLECKRKERQKTYKQQCFLTREQYQEIVDGRYRHSDSEEEVLSKFYLQYRKRGLRPKIIVAYERKAYTYRAGNVRITFDRNLGGTTKIADFLQDRIALRPVMPSGQHILEVKYDELLPDYLYQAMNLRDMRQTNMSKYYLCRRLSL